MHLRSPSIDKGVQAFIWAVVFFLFMWLGALAIKLPGGASFVVWNEMVLTGDLETMAALRASSPGVVQRINLGGIHHRPGRRERLPYLYLTDQELNTLLTLEAGGALITAQDLPTTPPVSLGALG